MHNVWLIARREYVERIRTRGFLITTVMIPLIMGGFIFVSAFINSNSESVAHIAIVSSDTQLALDLQTELQQPQESRPRSARQPRITVDAIDLRPQSAQATRAILDRDLYSGDIDGYLWITPPATPAKAGPTRRESTS